MKRLFLKNEFTKNTIILVFGTILAQSIPLFLHPFLRRIYSAEDFGAMSVYFTVFSMITIVSALRYEATIVLPKSNNIAANILSLTFIINAFFFILILLIVLLFKKEVIQLINLPEKYAHYIYFLPFACFFFGIYQSMNFWLIRQKAFKASSTNKIIRRGIEGVTQVILGVLKINGGLFIGDLTGNLANVIAGAKQIFKHKYNLQFVSRKKIGYVFKKYIAYPKYNVIPTLLSSAASLLPFLFINKMYSTEMVGYLDLSKLVLSIPLIFISATISQVLFQQITEKKNDSRSIKNDVKNILYILFIIILLELFVILLFGEELFGFIFGSKYELSGSFSQILIFSFVLNFISSTFSSIFITFEKIRFNSRWQIMYFLAICSLLFVKEMNIFDFLKVYVAIELIMHLIYCGMIYFIISKYETGLKKTI